MNARRLLDLVNSDVRALSAYHLTPDNVQIKLNQNENPFDWPQHIKDEIAEYCRTRPWNRYPNFVPDGLKNALALYTGLRSEQILAGNGSNEMLLVLLLSLSMHRGPVLFCQPTFTVYRLLASGLGREVHEVMLNGDLTYDIPRIVDKIRETPRAFVILASPNNPTGGALCERDVRTLLDAHQGFLLLDQAYVEFGGYDALPLLAAYPNLIITRTFSKAMRGAGLRLGYMCGAPEIIAEVNKIKLPYNINFFSEYVAIKLLEHRRELEETVSFLTAQRDSLYRFLTALPLDKVYPSAANFILIRTGRKDALFASLKERGILVRDVSSYPMLSGCLRINVGTAEENERLRDALSGFFTA